MYTRDWLRREGLVARLEAWECSHAISGEFIVEHHILNPNWMVIIVVKGMPKEYKL